MDLINQIHDNSLAVKFPNIGGQPMNIEMSHYQGDQLKINSRSSKNGMIISGPKNLSQSINYSQQSPSRQHPPLTNSMIQQHSKQAQQ